MTKKELSDEATRAYEELKKLHSHQDTMEMARYIVEGL